MLWTILALISLVALGGFIAYYGDLQGRRWGKKRVSWFGLRPKHTAILITSLTGAFIAILSIGTLLTINAPLRDVLLRGEAAIRENKQLNANLVAQRDTYDRSLKEKQTELQITNAQIGPLRAEVTDLTNNVKNVTKQVAQKQIELTQRQAEVSRLETLKCTLEATTKRLAEKIKILDEQNVASGLMNNTLGKQNETLSRENYKLSKTNNDLTETNTKLAETNKNLLQLREGYTKTNQVLEESNRMLLDQNRDLLFKNQAQARQAEDLNNRIAQLNREYDYLSGERLTIAQSYLSLRQGKFSLRAGAELARRTLYAHSRPEKVRAVLTEMLKEASAVAVNHGAATAGDPPYRAVRYVNASETTLAGLLQETDEDAALNKLVDRLVARDTPVVVVANTLVNSLEGERVLIDLTPYPVHTVFEKGDTVASGEIDARQPVGGVFDSLVQFLNKEVRASALNAGMIPQNDPETGSQRFGSIETIDLYKLAERIRRMGGQVQITARAKDKTTSADPLRLDFKLARPQANPPPKARHERR